MCVRASEGGGKTERWRILRGAWIGRDFAGVSCFFLRMGVDSVFTRILWYCFRKFEGVPCGLVMEVRQLFVTFCT